MERAKFTGICIDDGKRRIIVAYSWEQRKYAEVIELLSGQDFNPDEYNEDGIGIPYLTV